MRYADALAELDGRVPTRMVPDLDRVTEVAKLLDSPQLSYPTIHVTGTNGKTTTSRLAAHLACAHGLTTGLYTSPHLLSVNERMSVCGTDITDAEFGEEYEHLLPFLQLVDAMGEDRVTYFEVLTSLAFLWFADKPVALGVFEVGMGGEWDATNVVAGDVAVLCPIALDHPELGPTIADKAREKSKIIKPGRIAVVRDQPDEAMDIIQERVREVGASLVLEDQDYGIEERAQAVGGQLLTIRGLHQVYDEIFLSLFGPYAGHAAAAAVAAMEAEIGGALDDAALREAFGSASSPGRLEVVGRHPLVVIDGAHNPAGAGALAESLEDSFTWNRLLLVLAVSGDKDIPGVVEPLAPLAAKVFAAHYEFADRSAQPEVVAEAALAAGAEEVSTSPTVATALAAALAEAEPDDMVLVTGSLFTVADARRALG